MIDVNFWAVIVAGIVSMVLGFLWYGPVFGKKWMGMMGYNQSHIDEAKAKGGMGKSYLIAFIGSLVTAYVLAHIITMAQIAGISSGVSGGLQSGFWAWLGFIATVGLGGVLWEGRKWNLYTFNMAYQLVNLLLMGLIIGAWM